ncbi:MAG: succinyldiaminopimelate transaminase [Gammaproteobacteria bacterium]
MNSDLDKLLPYPFEKLQKLKAAVTPPTTQQHIALSIGEPQHPAPEFAARIFQEQFATLNKYPLTKGLDSLRHSIGQWLQRRFQLPTGALDIDRHILPVNGTREALFAFAQAVVDRQRAARVMMPNPFYQIYEGAALLAGAEPYYLNTTEANDFLPELDSIPPADWRRCQLFYLCSPGNPTGKVASQAYLQRLIALSQQYDFVIASDECYSEIYFDDAAPPPGLLQAAWDAGLQDFDRCVVFHSLSKRSNLPGLRSGFVAGDAEVIRAFLLYRTYHGCAMSVPYQYISSAAWSDEEHVRANRHAYRDKFSAVLAELEGCLDVRQPDAGFYLWARTPGDDCDFAQQLFARQNVTVLPGSYLSRDTVQGNPGSGRVRMALVAPLAECIEAARRIKAFMQHG